MVIYLEDAFFTVKERRLGDISGENELRVEEGSTFANVEMQSYFCYCKQMLEVFRQY